jgi:hypothetical protein
MTTASVHNCTNHHPNPDGIHPAKLSSARPTKSPVYHLFLFFIFLGAFASLRET